MMNSFGWLITLNTTLHTFYTLLCLFACQSGETGFISFSILSIKWNYQSNFKYLANQWDLNLAPTLSLLCTYAKVLQLYLTLCDPMDHSPPGSSVHGILQAKILEWVAMPSSKGSSQPRDWTLHWQVGSLPLAPSGKPLDLIISTTYPNVCSDKTK